MKNRLTHAWWWPLARIEKTVSDASNVPMDSQISAIQSHGEAGRGRIAFRVSMSTFDIVVLESPLRRPFAAGSRYCAGSGLARRRECRNTTNMRVPARILIVAPILLLGWVALPQTRTAPKHGPLYTQDGQLRLPADYREWVYLTSGFDMSYNPDMKMDHSMFDNVFVNPEAWRAFQSTGKWPDKTILVLELRRAEGKGSINQKGNFQAEAMGVECM